jgi:hypothetical protein
MDGLRKFLFINDINETLRQAGLRQVRWVPPETPPAVDGASRAAGAGVGAGEPSALTDTSSHGARQSTVGRVDLYEEVDPSQGAHPPAEVRPVGRAA